MSTEELDKLRAALPWGSNKKIALALSAAGETISAEAVGQVLAGKFENEAVINEALKILELKKATSEILSNRLAQLI